LKIPCWMVSVMTAGLSSGSSGMSISVAVFPDDFGMIPAGVFHDPPVGQFQQFGPFSEDQGFRRAHFHAGRGAALFQGPLGAHGALHDPGREGFGVFVGRNLERAGDHAVPAADAFPGIVGHRTLGGFFQGANDAGRHAGGVLAMQALHLDVERLVGACGGGITVYDGIGFGIGPPHLVKHACLAIGSKVSMRQPVLFRARPFTTAAADAEGRVGQNAEPVRIQFGMRCGRFRSNRGQGRGARDRPRDFEEIPTTDHDVVLLVTSCPDPCPNPLVMSRPIAGVLFSYPAGHTGPCMIR